MANRGITVSHETVRERCLKFGEAYAKRIRSQNSRPRDVRQRTDETKCG